MERIVARSCDGSPPESSIRNRIFASAWRASSQRRAKWRTWNPSYVDAVVSFSHLLSTVNSSINFVIYCSKDANFREGLVKMFAPLKPTRLAVFSNGGGSNSNGTHHGFHPVNSGQTVHTHV